MIQRLKDAWEIHKNVEPDILIEAALTKYNNMVEQNIWDQKDPTDAKMLALTTKLDFVRASIQYFIQNAW